MGKLLIDERPLTVLPSLVKAVGMERAVILQQIHWLLGLPKSGIDHDGEHWVWGTYDEWCAEYFPFWTPESLRKHVKKLEDSGFVICIQIKGFDRTKAYRIDYQKVKEIETLMREDVTTSKRNNVRLPMREDVTACNREDITGSMREDVTTSKREDVTTSKREDVTASYITKTSTETSKEKLEDDDLLPPLSVSRVPSGRVAVHAAWQQAYREPMPANLLAPMDGLTVECDVDAVIHAVKMSAANGARTFAYIATCARNYIPPAPEPPAPSYAVDLPTVPGVYRLTPAPFGVAPPRRAGKELSKAAAQSPKPKPAAMPPLPPPLAHGDPWAVAVTELTATLPGSAPAWLKGSRLEANDELAGVPFYRVVLTCPGASAEWMMQQCEPAIRKKISSLFNRRVEVEIIADAAPELEPTP